MNRIFRALIPLYKLYWFKLCIVTRTKERLFIRPVKKNICITDHNGGLSFDLFRALLVFQIIQVHKNRERDRERESEREVNKIENRQKIEIIK